MDQTFLMTSQRPGIDGSENELEHYGVLGMKWGVRRTPEQLGHPKPMSERKRRKEIRKARRKAVRNRRYISDKELTDAVSRMEKEKKLRDLYEDDSAIRRGKKAVKNAIGAIGSKVIVPAVVGTTAYAVKTAMTGDFSVKEAAQYIAPNPNKKK